MPCDTTVIIPVHNGAATLRSCLLSVLDQDVADFEVIVVDDGSTDESASIIEQAARSDERLRLIRLARSVGPGAARNHAIRAAKGDIILMVDSDCEVSRGWVRGHREAHQRWRIVGGGVVGVHTTMFGHADGYSSWFGSIPIREGGGQPRDHLPTANLSVRREVFERIGLFREGERLYSEDAELCERARRLGEQLYFDPSIVIRHHDRDSLRAFLRHQWVAGIQMLNYRREPGANYRWLMPRGRWSAVVLALPLAFAYTAFIAKEWIAFDAKVVLYTPLIFVGKLAQSAAMIAYSNAASTAELEAPRLEQRIALS